MVVITNIDNDHLECYNNSYAELENAFTHFANSVPFYGRVVLCIDEPSLTPIIPHIKRPMVTYGVSSGADVKAVDIRYESGTTIFTIEAYSQQLGTVRLPLPGVHNVLNALAAIAISYELGVKFEDICDGLEAFEGVHRRFEIVGTFNDYLLVSDFAHHPSEIAATLSAARSGWSRRIVALFQPHLFSRTEALATEFGAALMGADVAVALPIFHAREKPIENVSGQLICDAAKRAGHKNAHYYPERDKVVNDLNVLLQPGDMVLIMGAGEINSLVDKVRKKLMTI